MKICLYTIFTLILFLTFACSGTHKDDTPKRPTNVPQKAFWVGGKDGGNWYEISNIDSIAETVHFIIYNEYNGTIEINKNFKLYCPRKNPFKWEEISSIINGFDGKRIFLNQISSEKSWCYFE